MSRMKHYTMGRLMSQSGISVRTPVISYVCARVGVCDVVCGRWRRWHSRMRCCSTTTKPSSPTFSPHLYRFLLSHGTPVMSRLTTHMPCHTSCHTCHLAPYLTLHVTPDLDVTSYLARHTVSCTSHLILHVTPYLAPSPCTGTASLSL